MKKLFLLALFAALAMPQAAQADVVAMGFEFETAGDAEGWTANGANAPTFVGQFFATSGEGVLAGSGTNGDPRALHNPDFSLGAGFTNWTTLVARVRQLDPATGDPRVFVDSTNPAHLFMGVQSGGSFISTNVFTEETPGDAQNWMIASVDISGAGAGDITQVRADVVQGAGVTYQIDYVRLSAAQAVPEPSSLAMLGLAGVAMFVRRRK